MVKLSVVAPFHDVEDYLGPALESLARQTLTDLEVIMVDDGSTDGSVVIAKEYAARDQRFRLIQQPNAGPGLARNAGIRVATGEYLAFFDGDDLLDPHAYHLLTKSLDETGSDFAAGGCTKFNSSGPIKSWLHDEPFRKTVLRTHVSRFPVLLQDRTTTNKVFRRAFWDANNLEFPGGLYEDPPVAIRAHVLATSVDVFQDVVYYWRVRDTGALSTTQRSWELGNLEERMAAVSSVARFLAEHTPALKPAFDTSVLKGDFALLVQAFEFADDKDRARIAELAAGYARTVDAPAYRDVPAYNRLTCHLLAHQKLPELLEVLRYRRRDTDGATQVVRGEGPTARWYARYPFFGDQQAAIPADMYDVTKEMTLLACLDGVSWHGRKLRLEGYAYIRRLSSATPGECGIQVVLHNSRTRRTIRLPVTRVRRPDVTTRSRQSATCYDWSGFAVEVDARRLATLPGVWRVANWELRVEVSGGGLRREGPISFVQPGSAQWPVGRWVTGSVWLQPAPESDGRFVIRGQHVSSSVTSCTALAGALVIEGWSRSPLTAAATVVARPRKGGMPAVRARAEPLSALPGGITGRGRYAFRAQIPVGNLISKLDAANPIDRIVHVHDEFTWDVSIDSGEGRPVSRLAISQETAGARVSQDGREVTAFATHFGFLSLLERTVRPVVTSLEWSAAQQLVLRGDYTGPGTRPDALTMRHVLTGREHVLPLSWDGVTFTAGFDPSGLPGPVGPLPLASGPWHVLAAAGPLQARVAVAASRTLLPGLPGYHRTGLHEIEAQPYHTDALRLDVRIARDESEDGPYALRQLKTGYYPKAAAEPIRELAVFDSFSSRHYACNPRAIYEEMRRSHPGLECAWITDDGQFSVPDGARVIPANSREHFSALAQARYIIVNDELPRWFAKRDGQTCLQTWHGTPLKRIGLDVARPQFASGLIYHEMVRRASGNWDLLLSPNPFSTPIFRRAFGYEGEILETGYPRNDLLHQDSGQRAAAVRRQLGLPAGKRVILYAPTWRENPARQAGGYRFDLQLDLPAMASTLGRDHVLLLRLHTNALQSQLRGASGDFVTNVTSYPDITDLLLITDVLITDYSSVMFDFAGTGRPMLFFTYDLDTYRDKLRGFYFDFEAEAPGPLLRTTADIIAVLGDLPAVQRAYGHAYRNFTARYCPLDDGAAAPRVVHHLLSAG